MRTTRDWPKLEGIITPVATMPRPYRPYWPVSCPHSAHHADPRAGARTQPRRLLLRIAVWLLPVMITLALVPLGCAGGVSPTQLAPPTGAPQPGIEECGTLKLPSEWQPEGGGSPLNGTALGGLSALGWDSDAQRLYLLSDRGQLYQARLDFTAGRLSGFSLLATLPLKSADGQPLEDDAADAESLIVEDGANGVAGDATLLVGFERQHRLQRFTPDGQPVGQPMRPTGFEGADFNAGAEALAIDRREGLVVGLEGPPEGMPAGITRLFAPASGRQWRYTLAPEAGSGLTALEGNGDTLLALERAFAPPAPLVISLRRVRLTDSGEAEVETLARLSSGEGWRLDNFEGLTRLDDGRFLMVSDDNFIALQTTLLSCFSLPSD